MVNDADLEAVMQSRPRPPTPHPLPTPPPPTTTTYHQLGRWGGPPSQIKAQRDRDAADTDIKALFVEKPKIRYLAKVYSFKAGL